jgi:hypothetical protein
MKYLFKALLNDGSFIEQTQDDKSSTTEGKNAFYDVLQNLNELRAFALYNQETGDEALIDLKEQRFEINNASFFLHEESVTNVRLVFFKRNTIDCLTGETLPVQYFLGFQANNEAGQNVQFTIRLV